MQSSRAFLADMKPYLPPEAPILSVTKGVEQSTFCLMNDVIQQTLGAERRAAFLSGPSFAKEIMDGQATAVVIASTDDLLASELTEIMSSVEFRCHTSRDVKVLCTRELSWALNLHVGGGAWRGHKECDSSGRGDVRGPGAGHERHVFSGHPRMHGDESVILPTSYSILLTVFKNGHVIRGGGGDIQRPRRCW